MDSQTLKDIGVVLYYFNSPVATAPIINGAAQGDVISPLLNTTQILVGFTDTLEGFAKLGKYAPLVGIGLSTISLSSNVKKIWDDMDAGVQPKLSDYYGALSDAAGIMSSVALAVAAGGATAAVSPVLLTAGVVAAVISATLTVASLAVGPKATIDLQYALAVMHSSFAEIKGAAGDLWDLGIQQMHDALDAGAELNDVVGSYLEKQGELIKNSLLEGADKLSSSFDELLQSLSGSFEDALQTVSPLVLDLNGDGFKMTGVAGNTYFDHDANGVKEKSGWMDSHDGMLVRDLNHNGTVDSGLEVFGNNTVLSNGRKAANGFEALKDLDSNHDGVFDARDAAYGEVKIWVDANGNAQSDSGELRTLAEAGIDSINLSYNSASVLDEHGNRILQLGTYTSAGATKGVADEWFVTDPTTNIMTGHSGSGPDLAGRGTVGSMQQEISTGNYRLQSLLEEFKSALTDEERSQITNEIIYEWTGANDHSSISRGSYIDDSRKLYALEAFMGKNFVQSSGTNEGTSSPGPNAAALLMTTFSKLSEFVESSLALQITYSQLLDALHFSLDGTSYNLNAEALISSLREKFSADPVTGGNYLEGFVKALKIAGGDFAGPVLAKLAGYQVTSGDPFGLALHSALDKKFAFSVIAHYGTTGSDLLQGTTGSDIIYGDKGDDIIFGGAGDDFLSGDEGRDTYKFELGWGKDSLNVLAKDGASDRLEFGIGIKSEDIILSRVDESLILSYVNGDKVTLINYFFVNDFTPPLPVTITFSDGQTWTENFIRQAVATLNLDDTVQGTSSADVISTGGGNDTINGLAGNDVLNGGTGNDVLNGGVGSDTYVFGIGDGHDVINETSVSTTSSTNDVDVVSFLSGVTALSVNVSANGNDLILSYNAGLDSVSIKGWFSTSYDRYQIERIEFSDGTVWQAAELTAQFNYFNGSDLVDILDRSAFQISQYVFGNGGDDRLATGAGNDLVSGGSGNDTLSTAGGNDQITGGTGNDTLSGGTGSDIYFFNLGDGQDTIQETSLYTVGLNDGSVDVLKFGTGISATDISVSASGNDVVFTHANGTDKITVKGWLSSAFDRYQIERVEFADGTVWTSAAISSQLLEFQGTEGDDMGNRSGIPAAQKLYGYGGNDTLSSGDGNDIVMGGSGNDTLSTAGGNDQITGGTGNDTLSGGTGSDIYFFNLGDGQDTIQETSLYTIGLNDGSVDVLKFGAGITTSDIGFRKAGNDMVIGMINSNDSIVVKDWYSTNYDRFKLEKIMFVDGHVLSASDIESIVLTGVSPASD